MHIIIAGDLVPTESNIELFNTANLNILLGRELLDLWNSADKRIFNLEVPLTEESKPINKCGLNLRAPKSTILGIKTLNPSLVTLANNHILDQGARGLNSTISILKDNCIPFVGAGSNLIDASKPYIIFENELKVGIYACAEYEFSIATEYTPGANPFDPLESLDHLQELKKQCDYVIVIYHGGKEHYRYPSPYLQKVSRKMVDKGTDLVVCQHSHCIGAFEKYKNSIIVYGQGNFIFNKHNNEFCNNSLLLSLTIDNNGMNIDYIPIVTTDKGVRLANLEGKNTILKEFYERSEKLLENGFIENEYKLFAERKIDYYLRSLFASSKLTSYIDHRILKGKLIRNKFNKKRLLAVQNYIECEAHRELILAGIKGRIEG